MLLKYSQPTKGFLFGAFAQAKIGDEGLKIFHLLILLAFRQMIEGGAFT